MPGYTHTLLAYTTIPCCVNPVKRRCCAPFSPLGEHCTVYTVYIYHVSFPSQKEVWLKSQLSSSESGGPAVVRLETSTSNDRVTASLQCIGQQELQFPYLSTEK